MELTGKRPAEDEVEFRSKRFKTDFENRNILDFSDCVLLQILSLLNSYDLYILSKTCNRFNYLIRDRKLWKKVNLLDHPMCSRKFDFFFKNVHNNTDTIMVNGISKKEKALTYCQFIKMNNICEDLTILAIENQYINSDEIMLKNFPESLKELSLRGTHIYGKQPFLQDAHIRLTNLHTLILANCKWFHEHSLMALSKLINLENLSLYKCANLNDSVAYMSITAKFGFRKLRRIDARCTSIGDQFLKCFHCVKTLREIYLEAPERRKLRRRALPRTNPNQQFLDELRLTVNRDSEQPARQEQNIIDDFEVYRERCPGVNLRCGCREPFREIGVQHVIGANGATAVVLSTVPRRGRNEHPKKEKAKAERQAPNREPSFNCVERCIDCSLDECSVMPIAGDKPNVQIHENSPKKDLKLNDQPSDCACCEISNLNEVNPLNNKMRHWELANRKTDDPPTKPGTSKQYCDKSKNSSNSQNLKTDSNVQNSQSGSASTISSQPSSPSSKNLADSQKADPYEVTDEDLEIIFRYELEEDDLPETLYCDDVSDTEDEDDVLLEDLEMMQADVTDAGVQWFMGAKPDSQDPPGEPSLLFQSPYSLQEFGSEIEIINDQPGPSGYKLPGRFSPPLSDPTLLPPPSPTRRSHVTFSQNAASSSDSDDSGPAPAPREAPEPFIPPQIFVADLRGPRAIQLPFGGNVVIRNPRLRPHRRDLRVIIERLEPGVHLVYNGAEPREYSTRLKVLMCRGYRNITDVALRSLTALNLEFLDVRGTRVTASGVNDFLQLNPDCQLLHDTDINHDHQPSSEI